MKKPSQGITFIVKGGKEQKRREKKKKEKETRQDKKRRVKALDRLLISETDRLLQERLIMSEREAASPVQVRKFSAQLSLLFPW